MPIKIGSNEIDLPNIHKVVICTGGEQNVIYESIQPFYIESAGAQCELQLTKVTGNGSVEVWFRSNPELITEWASADKYFTCTLEANDAVYLKGTTDTFAVDGEWTCNNNFNIGGDFMSLANYSTVATDRMFFRMFNAQDKLINAKNSILSATTVYNQAYAEMFSNCFSLLTPPVIRGTKFISGTFQMSGMFSYCIKLTTIPKLTIEELSKGTCYNMFYECSKLTWPTGAFNIKATTIPDSAFYNAFINCADLNVLAADALNTFKNVVTVGNESFSGCFGGCQSLTTAFKFENLETVNTMSFASMYTMCYNLTKPFIPGHSTKLKLNSTTDCTECFSYMFDECTSLNVWPSFPYVEIGYDCYSYTFSNCSSLTVSEAPEAGYDYQFMIGSSNPFESPGQSGTFENVPSTHYIDTAYSGTTYYTKNQIYSA